MHDRMEAVALIERYAARLAADPRFGAWAVTHPDNQRSIRVCRTIGMRLLGVTHRWYHEPSLMFRAGATADGAPSLGPDEPART
ncbi:MAG TPA: hypothetical protein VIK04_00375 [Solirubrobacteraceae bacterium]